MSGFSYSESRLTWPAARNVIHSVDVAAAVVISVGVTRDDETLFLRANLLELGGQCLSDQRLFPLKLN